ncbi:MAG: alginate O-acetyltransferase AlgX-related protein [Planctomycetota bacterium]
MTRRAFARGFAAALSLAATLVLLEIPAYLGWIDWSSVVGMPHALRFTHLKPWDNPANVRDEELLYRHRPGMRFRGETPGDLVDLFGIATDRKYPIDVAYDENGFRNPPGRTRADVVLLGDSFLEAGLVPWEETAGAILERELGLLVSNLGCSGYGPQQQKIALARYGLPQKPRVVVWFFFEGNDLLDVSRYEAARRTGLRKSSFLARSLTANLARRIELLADRPRGEDADTARQRMGTMGSTRIYFAYAGAPLSERDRASLVQAKTTIRSAADMSRPAGARFLLAFIPTKFRVHEGLAEFAADSVCSTWRSNELPELLARFAGEAGIEWIDLTPPLRASAERGELPYFPDDGHWSPRGHAVVAAALAERLR